MCIRDRPQVDGSYTLETEVELASGGSKLYNLKAIVEKRGYVYEDNPRGEIRLSGAVITLHYLNPKTQKYEIWPAESYDQINPQLTDSTGRYFFLAPAGDYYLTVQKNDYRNYQSNTITLSVPGPIVQKIQMTYKESWLQKINPFN